MTPPPELVAAVSGAGGDGVKATDAPGPRPHLLAAAMIACAVLVLTVGTLLILARAADRVGEDGRLLVWFPPGAAAEARFLAVAGAGARPLRESSLPGLILVAASGPEDVARLRAGGAGLVLRALPSDLFGLAGCGFGWASPRADDRTRP
jgi:hypothetical protein